MLESFGSTIYTISEDYIYKGKTDWLNYFNFLNYIIVFIGAMIYNEVLIINKCGLNLNTRLFLDYKFSQENKNSNYLNGKENDYENDDSEIAVSSNYLIDLNQKNNNSSSDSNRYSSSLNDD